MILIASIFVFCVAAVFRLLDNSAGLLISNGISVTPFYLSAKEIKEKMENIENPKLLRRLRSTLLFRKLHKLFLVLAILTFITGIVYEIMDPTLLLLF
jgi:type III secretory pathway component EscU